MALKPTDSAGNRLKLSSTLSARPRLLVFPCASIHPFKEEPEGISGPLSSVHFHAREHAAGSTGLPNFRQVLLLSTAIFFCSPQILRPPYIHLSKLGAVWRAAFHTQGLCPVAVVTLLPRREVGVVPEGLEALELTPYGTIAVHRQADPVRCHGPHELMWGSNSEVQFRHGQNNRTRGEIDRQFRRTHRKSDGIKGTSPQYGYWNLCTGWGSAIRRSDDDNGAARVAPGADGWQAKNNRMSWVKRGRRQDNEASGGVRCPFCPRIHVRRLAAQSRYWDDSDLRSDTETYHVSIPVARQVKGRMHARVWELGENWHEILVFRGPRYWKSVKSSTETGCSACEGRESERMVVFSRDSDFRGDRERGQAAKACASVTKVINVHCTENKGSLLRTSLQHAEGETLTCVSGQGWPNVENIHELRNWDSLETRDGH
ncbi:hypothetical protein DFH09DRAFT_1085745 [Mycena vulgaris]|nr:hypothetical protein DFH09DRAFT_1085745 [Mycena vulgaris]